MNDYFKLIDDKELLDMFAESVKIKSINPPGKELKMCEYVEGILKKENISYKKVEVEKDRYDILAKIEGKTSKDAIIFTGHMDVVPVSDEEMKRWDMDPFSAEIKDGYLYGRGSSDMKSGLIAALYAMIVLKRNNIVPETDIILAATIDEENYMKGSKKLLKDPYLKDAKYLVVCEPTNLKLCNRGKGRTWADIYVKGKTSHGSQESVGENAIYLAIKLIELIKNTDINAGRDLKDGHSFWRTLAIEAGVEPQVVPDRCKFTVDARLAVGHKTDDVWKVLEKLIDEVKTQFDDFEATYDVIDKRESWETKEDEKIVVNFKKALGNLNIPYEKDLFMGSTDASVLVKDKFIPVIIGPGDLSKVHRENECVKIDDLYKATRLYLNIMLED